MSRDLQFYHSSIRTRTCICKLEYRSMSVPINKSQKRNLPIFRVIVAIANENFDITLGQNYIFVFTTTTFCAVCFAHGPGLKRSYLLSMLTIILNFVQFRVHFATPNFTLRIIAKTMKIDFMKKLMTDTNVTCVHLPITQNTVCNFIRQNIIRRKSRIWSYDLQIDPQLYNDHVFVIKTEGQWK